MRRQPEGGRFQGGSARALSLRTFSLLGIVADDIVSLTRTFETAGPDELVATLRDEAGHPWAAHAFEDAWATDPAEARRRGLFDLVWHRRALQIDPFMAARDFAGFDVLLDAARRVSPAAAELLAHVDGNSPDNPRAQHGPPWWEAWHGAAATQPGGWLELDEVRALSDAWSSLATPEVEEACLGALGVAFTHPGCWTLLWDLGGFFAQCASEGRVVVVEVDG